MKQPFPRSLCSGSFYPWHRDSAKGNTKLGHKEITCWWTPVLNSRELIIYCALCWCVHMSPGETLFGLHLFMSTCQALSCCCSFQCFCCHLSPVQGTVASTASCIQLHKRAERVAVALMEKGRLNVGDHVALVYPPGKTTQTAKPTITQRKKISSVH